MPGRPLLAPLHEVDETLEEDTTVTPLLVHNPGASGSRQDHEALILKLQPYSFLWHASDMSVLSLTPAVLGCKVQSCTVSLRSPEVYTS